MMNISIEGGDRYGSKVSLFAYGIIYSVAASYTGLLGWAYITYNYFN